MHNDPETNSLPQWDDTQSPFRIPDGYFDTLTARVMHNIPAEPAAQPAAATRSMKPYLRWAAVSLATIGIGIGVWLAAERGGLNTAPRTEAAQAAAQMPAGDNLEQMADYMMLDQEDFYAYLSAE